MRVLIVDDDRGVLQGFKRLLGAEHEVTTASSAAEALNLLVAGHRFDVIFCDVWMPGEDGDGMGFYEQVQKTAAAQAPRVIFMTGGGLPDRLERFLAKHTVVGKPFDRKNVISRMEHVVATVGPASTKRRRMP